MQKALNPYEGSSNYYEFIDKLYTKQKNELMDILKNTPFKIKPLEPEGGFFVLVDIRDAIPTIPIKYFYKDGKNDSNNPVGNNWKGLENPDFASDYAMTRWMTYEYGVSPIPLSPFYDNSSAKNVTEYKETNYVRFAICKSDETMKEVRTKLTKKWHDH